MPDLTAKNRIQNLLQTSAVPEAEPEVDPVVLQESDLLDPADFPAMREHMFMQAQRAVKNLEPTTNAKYTLRVTDPTWRDDPVFTPSDITNAVRQRTSLFRTMDGKLELTDNDTGEVVTKSQKRTLMHVPYFTDDGTYVLDGTEMSLVNQPRTDPGIYIGMSGAGIPQAQITTGRGGGFKIAMDPGTGVLNFQIKGRKIPAYHLLRRMGVPDEHLEGQWGPVFGANRQAKVPSSFENWVKDVSEQGLVRIESGQAPDSPGLTDTQRGLRAWFGYRTVTPEIVEKTTGVRSPNLTPEMLANAAGNVSKMYRDERPPDARDSLAYQSVWTAPDRLADAITRDRTGIMRNILWKVTNKGDLSAVPTAPLNPYVSDMFTNSGTQQVLEQINPLDMYNQAHRLSWLGDGGISSVDAAPMSARMIHPSYYGYIDLVRTPESNRVGLDMHLARGVRIGPDRQLYRKFLDTSIGDTRWVGMKEAAAGVVGFPDMLTTGKDDKYVNAMDQGEIKIVPRTKVTFILPNADDVASAVADSIQMKSGVKGMRQLMGAKFISQALPMVAGEKPLVRTKVNDTYSEAVLGKHMGAIRSPSDGVVEKLTKDAVVIRTAGGGTTVAPLYDYRPYARKTYHHSYPEVKVGQKVTQGQLLARSDFVDKSGDAALVKNLRMAYLPYGLYTYEDGHVISESAAEKTKVRLMLSPKFDVDDDNVLDRKVFMQKFPGSYSPAQFKTMDDGGVVKEGTVLQYGDPLYLGIRTRTPEEATMDRPLLTDASKTWEHPTPGRVVRAVKREDGVIVDVVTEANAEVGDKLSISQGGKGVISLILPDDQMPVDSKGRPLEVMLNPHSIESRLNPPQLSVAALGKVVRETGVPYELPGFFIDDDTTISQFTKDELKKHGISEREDLYDPLTGRTIPSVSTGVMPFYRMQQLAEIKAKARGTGGYSSEGTPLRGGETGAKHIGCFPGYQKVLTPYGEKRISEIVEKKLREHVWTFDHTTGTWGFHPVSNWFTYEGTEEDLLTVDISGAASVGAEHKRRKHSSSMYPTRNHKVYLRSGEKVRADQLKVGDKLTTWGAVPSDMQRGALFGTLLGDAWCGRQGSTAEGQFFCEHSTKQEAYTRFKQTLFSGLLARVSSRHVHKQEIGGEVREYRASTVSFGHPELISEAWALCYSGEAGTKKVTADWLEQVSDLGIALWYLDDGWLSSRPKKKGQVRLCAGWAVNGYSSAEVDLLNGFLKDRIGISFTVQACKDRTPEKREVGYDFDQNVLVTYTRADCEKLIRFIAKHIPGEAIPKSKLYLRRQVLEMQKDEPPVKYSGGSELGPVAATVKSIRPFQHPKKARTFPVYDIEVQGPHTYAVAGVCVSNSMEIRAFTSHGADAALMDLKLIHGQQNSKLWSDFKAGRTPSIPNTPEVYKKFRGLIQAAGVDLRETGDGDTVYAMTSDRAEELTGDRKLQSAATYDQKMRPIRGGLFDPELTGGKFAYMELPEPMLNPVMETPVKLLLGLTGKQFDRLVAGEDGKSLAAELEKLDVDVAMADARRDIVSGSQTRRDHAYRKFGFLQAMKDQNIHPREFLLARLPVLPAEFRPITKMKNINLVPDVNRLYRDLYFKTEDFGEYRDTIPEMLPEARKAVYDSLKAVVGTASPTSPKLQQAKVGGILQALLGKGSPKNCYDDETELLTDQGWVPFKDYQGQALVATVHPFTHKLEYHQPSDIIHSDYAGEMISIDFRGKANLLVTPNHRNWVRHKNHKGNKDLSAGWNYVYAEDMVHDGTRMKMLRTAEGFDGSTTIPDWLSCSPEEFAEFVGYWVAEGWVHSDGDAVELSQCPTKNGKRVVGNAEYCKRIAKLVATMGLRYSSLEYPRVPRADGYKCNYDSQFVWSIKDKRLVDWLVLNVGKGASNKHLSRGVLNWDGSLLKALLKGYLSGDGAKRQTKMHPGSGTRHRYTHGFYEWHGFSTTSPRLMDNFVELGCKIGVPIKLSSILDGEPLHQQTQYAASICTCHYATAEGKGKECRKVQYEGGIHCVTVPNGLLLVRREGVTCVSGNSLVQRRVMGADIDIYGLGVIVPDPKLGLDEVGVPESQAWTIYQPFTVRKLVQRGVPPRRAVQLVEDRDPKARDAMISVMDDRPALLNRAPTLHKYSTLGFNAKLVQGHAIRINPYVCGGYNADFDGDQMSITVPVTQQAVQEIRDKMMPSKNLISEQGRPTFAPSQDVVHGLNILTRSPSGQKQKSATVGIGDVVEQLAGKYNRDEVDFDSPVIGA